MIYARGAAEAMRGGRRLTELLGEVGADGVQAAYEARCADEGVPCDVHGRPEPDDPTVAILAAAIGAAGCGCEGTCGRC